MVKSLRRTRPFSRPPCRPSSRRAQRRPHRSCLRHFAGYRRRPGDLAQALAAFTRAIRAHRRLAKLAPHLFDATEMNRIEQRKKEDAEWRAMWEPALEKVYGPSTEKWPEPACHMPLSPQTLRAVDRHYALWRFWMDVGSEALARFQRRQPYALPSLGQIARLLDVGFAFGRLACGEPAEPDPAPHAQALADLERAYGQPLPGEETMAEPHASEIPSVSSGIADNVEVPPPPPECSLPSLPPPDEKRDLVPHALGVGPHGFLDAPPQTKFMRHL